MEPAIKWSYTGECLKWEMAHQRQREKTNKCPYIQKKLRSSTVRLSCGSRGWRGVKANTEVQFTPIEDREKAPNPQTLQD